MIETSFPASRDFALDKLRRFVPYAGQHYASGRNTDPGPEHAGAVSKLSPYLRYRLITEYEVVKKVLEQHSLVDAEKFVQEVLWRTYWKGWLEMRPSVWLRFLEERDRNQNIFPDQRAILAAENGQTGIDCFDSWAHELVETGYLHNHARMWFASIWIFTLRLPWTLGADFFLRHLLDSDAASNTLSWRWVAGLQTAGKTYLATSENIARYTNGRFSPKGLSQDAIALTEVPIASSVELRPLPAYDFSKPSLLLVTHDDMSPESLPLSGASIQSVVIANDAGVLWGERARHFVSASLQETATRLSAHFRCQSHKIDKLDIDSLVHLAIQSDVQQIITAYAPIGPVADRLAQLALGLAANNINLMEVRRDWDSAFWPYARKGFFQFKTQIPALLREMGLL